MNKLKRNLKKHFSEYFLIFLYFISFFIFVIFFNFQNSNVQSIFNYFGIDYESGIMPILFLYIFSTFLLIILFYKYSDLFERIINFFRKMFPNHSLVILLAIFFVFVFSSVSYMRHISFQTDIFDFGLEHQVIHYTAEGELFYSSVEVNNYLGDHTSFLILPLSLLYKVFPNVLTIFFVQCLCVVIGGLGIYLFANRILKRRLLSIPIFLMYLFYIGNSGLLFFDFHPVTLGVPFLVFGIYCFFFSKIKLGFILLFIASLAKEEIGLFLFSTSLYFLFKNYILTKKIDIRLLVSGLFGLIFSVVALFIIIPFFRNGQSSDTLERYSYLGSGFSEILRTLFLNPILVVNNVLTLEKVSYIARLLFPVMFLSLIRLDILFLATPFIAINILSNYSPQYTAINQYDSVTSVVVFIALIFAIGKLLQNSYSKQKFIILLIFSLFFINLTFLPFHRITRSLLNYRVLDTEINFINEFKKKITNSDIVVATGKAGAHLGEIRNLYNLDPQFLGEIKIVDYVIFDKFQNYHTSIWDELEKLIKLNNLEIYLKSEFFVVYKKNEDSRKI